MRENWMQTYSGLQFFPHDPKLQDIRVLDIAHALSMICRYTGHTKVFYSVAEHSIIMSWMVPEEYALEALLHDAHEAYINDIAKPFKNKLPDYQHYEDKMDLVIRKSFDLPEKKSDVIKEADLRMLETERQQVMPDKDEDCPDWYTVTQGIKPYDVVLPRYVPRAAKNVFLGRFSELWKNDTEKA